MGEVVEVGEVGEVGEVDDEGDVTLNQFSMMLPGGNSDWGKHNKFAFEVERYKIGNRSLQQNKSEYLSQRVQDVAQGDKVEVVHVAVDDGDETFEQVGVEVIEHGEPLHVCGELRGVVVGKVRVQGRAQLVQQVVVVQGVAELDKVAQDGRDVLRRREKLSASELDLLNECYAGKIP